MKTERVVVLVTPEQKRALLRRARALELSMGELLRRSAAGGSDDDGERALADLAAELQKSARQGRTALRSALAETQATLRQLKGRREERRVA